MPTYASTSNFDLTIDQICQEAFERCGLQIRNGYDLQTAKRSLNLMLAEWANRGINLWTVKKQEKTLAAGTILHSNMETYFKSGSLPPLRQMPDKTSQNHLISIRQLIGT